MDYPQLKTAIHDYTWIPSPALSRRASCRIWCRSAMRSMAVCCGRKGKAGGKGGEFDRLAGLLNAAIDGLKANLHNGEQVKIMLHLAEGTKNDTFRWWFDEIEKRHVPYDVIGLSMYTYWNGPISALKANMDDISKRYNKDVIVVEAAYAYTPPIAITRKIVSSQRGKGRGYPASVQGQYRYIHDLMQAVIDVPDQRGKGIFTGSPRGLPFREIQATPAGMKYIHDEWKEGNARENQALFDCREKYCRR